MSKTSNTTIDDDEIARFSALASEWWNPRGKFRPLHKFNPIRLEYIKKSVCKKFERDMKDPKAFIGLRFLDIGCGGGLLCEPMARLGADVVGADPSSTNIEVAKIHAEQSRLDIDYRTETSEMLAANDEQFDVVLNMEVVEHVADVELFIASCAKMVKPGGLMFVATINRTLKARVLAIFMAENVLRWLPKGTHEYEKFVTPGEMETLLDAQAMRIIDRTGVFYNMLRDQWQRSTDMDVNYMILAIRE